MSVLRRYEVEGLIVDVWRDDRFGYVRCRSPRHHGPELVPMVLPLRLYLALVRELESAEERV